jgi:hypothetical protein
MADLSGVKAGDVLRVRAADFWEPYKRETVCGVSSNFARAGTGANALQLRIATGKGRGIYHNAGQYAVKESGKLAGWMLYDFLALFGPSFRTAIDWLYLNFLDEREATNENA